MNKKHVFWLLPLLAALLILCLACNGSGTDTQVDYNPSTGEKIDPNSSAQTEQISIVTPEPDLHREELDAILKRTTMLEGVTVNGVNVGGMTKEEAKAAVLPSLEESKKALCINVTLGDASEAFSGETIATTDNLDELIEEAFNLVREDKGFEAVSAEVEQIKTQGKDFPITLAFDEEALKAAVNAFADAHDTKPVDASFAYNKKENKIEFTQDVPGRTVDREALLAALLNAQAGETLTAPAEETAAAITLANAKEHYVLRKSYTTNYSKSNRNRKENIRHGAMDLLTGTVVHPGEVFSMNQCLGTRRNDGHWKIATAFQQGKHVKEYGGGVCQISSTLYNCAVMADMEIVFRQNHSMPVDYVDKGRDATINSLGNIIDFKFKNSSKADILIIANANGSTLTIEIWGIPIIEDSNGEYDEIRIPTPKKTKTLKPSGEVLYTVDASKPVGYKEKVAGRRDGSVWQSMKEYYLNGVLVKSEKLAVSTYKAYAGEYIVGPDATEAPETPKPTDPGSDTPKPSDPGSDTPKPSDPGSDTPKPTEEPTTPKPTEEPPKPTEEPTTPKPTEEPPKPTEPSGGDDGGE